MNFVSILILIFCMLGAFDRIFGNRFGLGKEFEKGFLLLGSMSLSMIGMIIISPLIADLLTPCFSFVHKTFKIDPSIIPASLFANDMGGASLAKEVAVDNPIGMFNGLVVSSMMGCTVTFTIPYALGTVKKELQRELLLGLLCGIVTIPLGCFVSGLIARIPLTALLINLLPLLLFSGVIACGLLFFPNVCVKIFSVLGVIIKVLITLGLALGIFKFMTGVRVIKGIDDIEEGALVCVNAAIVMSGSFPMLYVISKLLSKPMRLLGQRLGISEASAMGFVSTLASHIATLESLNNMDKKGVMLNAAFVVSAAAAFASHLAFTMAFDASLLLETILGKLIAGVLALLLAVLVYHRLNRKAVSAERCS